MNVSYDTEVDGVSVCASARVAVHEGVGYVSNVVVAYWGRRRGVGRALMEKVVAIADAQGLELWSECRSELVPFYALVGFEPVGPGRFGAVELRRARR